VEAGLGEPGQLDLEQVGQLRGVTLAAVVGGGGGSAAASTWLTSKKRSV